MTFTRALSTNNYGPAKFIVDGTTTANGTHSTIAAALTSASSGDTIFIRPGTYTENLTLKAGVNLTAYGCDSSLNATGKVIISGTCTFTAAGSVSLSGIQLQTNSAALLAVTGSAASIVNLENCYLNISNNDGITFSSSDAGARINMYRCNGNIGTTGIKFCAMSSAGVFNKYYTHITNSGASTTAATASAGTCIWEYSKFEFPFTTSGTNLVAFNMCGINTLATNTLALTIGGSGSTNRLGQSVVVSGSASAVTVSTNLAVQDCDINSSNTNAITGAGAIVYSGVVFSSTSSTINTTTQTGSGTLQGSKNTAPSAGFLGEQIRSAVASGSAVSLGSSGNAATITSITLTAGIWDISSVAVIVNSGTTTIVAGGISAVTNSFSLPQGDALFFSVGASIGAVGVSIPAYRVTISTSTTYYLVGLSTFSTGAATGYGRISGTRVG